MSSRPDAMRPRSRPRTERVRPRLRPKPMFLTSLKKNLTQQKHAFANPKNAGIIQHKINTKKLKPGS